MNTLLIRFSDYLKKNMGYEVMRITGKSHNLPVYITANYQIDTVSFNGGEFIIMMLDVKKGITPSQIQKHIQRIIQDTTLPVIVLASSITSYDRSRYIEKKIPFVIPFNQMYLPQMGLDLREYFLRHTQQKERLTPAAQAILLALIYKKVEEPVNANKLSEILDYSPMTMGRGIELLQSFNLVTINKIGKIKTVTLNKNHKEINKYQAPMINPVSHSFFSSGIPKNIPYVYSGLTALSNLSNLADNDYITIAIHKKYKKKVKETGLISDISLFDGQKCKIEFWEYNPYFFRSNENADILSVYNSVLEEYNDERILQAAEEMMKRMKW